jgi:hypothetical protein
VSDIHEPTLLNAAHNVRLNAGEPDTIQSWRRLLFCLSCLHCYASRECNGFLRQSPPVPVRRAHPPCDGSHHRAEGDQHELDGHRQLPTRTGGPVAGLGPGVRHRHPGRADPRHMLHAQRRYVALAGVASRVLNLTVACWYHADGSLLYCAPDTGRQGMQQLEQALLRVNIVCVEKFPAPQE